LPVQAPGGPHTLAVASGGASSEIRDVMFGEVWLATGQSNMVMPARSAIGGEGRLAQNPPHIRYVKVPQRTGLPVEKEYTADDLAWKTFGPGADIAATAFFFAVKLQPAVGRTVGIVQSSVGGTPAQAWTPMWALDEKPELKYYADQVREALASGKTPQEWAGEAGAQNQYRVQMKKWAEKKEGPRPPAPPEPHPGNPWNSKTPTVLFENMIAPLVPYTARGIIWYQGEGNSGKPDEYRVLFPAMISSWRKLWNRPDWPFFFVQLAAYANANDWPGLRAAQTFTRDTLPHTGMALAIDHGEEKDIHPKNKEPVGERLALLALDQVYGQKVVSRGPCFASASAKGGKVTVKFAHTADGLKTSDGKPGVPAFELAGADGKFQPALAGISGKDSIELSAEAVAAPKAVRYAWASWIEPPVTLQNSAGLPAEPFQSDLK
jgi:sialate O-acetylesterase